MRAIAYFACALLAAAGLAEEPESRKQAQPLTANELIGKLEELGAQVAYRGVPSDARNPKEEAIGHVLLDESWKGGDEGTQFLERLARERHDFRRLYIVGKPTISEERIRQLASGVGNLKIEQRGEAYLGVGGGNHPEGVQLVEVQQGSPAEKAGLRKWDVITTFGGNRTRDIVSLVEVIASKRPGDKIPVKYIRSGDEHTADVVLERWRLGPRRAAASRAGLLIAGRGQEYGHIEGQFVLDGDVPNLPPLVAKGANAKGAQVCAAKNVPDESLVVDSETKGIANIFLYMRRAPSSVHPDLRDPPKEPAVFDQKNCQFIPHALFVRAGQKVLVKSSDPIPHNTHTHPILNQEDNFIVRPNDQDGVPLTYNKPEILPTKVNCDLHPHMSAYWLILDHPYAAITDEQGKFKIENVPEGEHTFTVWHERVGYLDRAFKVTIQPNQTTALDAVAIPVAKLISVKRADR